MAKNIVLMGALVTNFCVVSLTAGDEFTKKVAEICPLLTPPLVPAKDFELLKAVTIKNNGLVYSVDFDISATEMEACLLYKNKKTSIEYYVCNDCGACFANGIHVLFHHFENSIVRSPNAKHPKNPALEKLEHVYTEFAKYKCKVCTDDTFFPRSLQAVAHVESQHSDEAQERYKQEVAAQLALAQNRTTSGTLKRLGSKRKPVFVFAVRTQYAQSRLREPKDV